uniref:DH domain-containing protein n=1 Tax=Parascaris equorum TaxID=6256 RepID=A0A914RJ44_PAREQ
MLDLSPVSIPFDEPSCSDVGTTTVAIEDGTASRRARSTANARKSIFFGKDKADMLSRLAALRDELQKPVAMFELEEHWTLIVANHADLSRRSQEQQEAIWEFVTTEHRYLQVIFCLLETMNSAVNLLIETELGAKV